MVYKLFPTLSKILSNDIKSQYVRRELGPFIFRFLNLYNVTFLVLAFPMFFTCPIYYISLCIILTAITVKTQKRLS
jgi:hypothetical protein